jgi:hypothetical protein
MGRRRDRHPPSLAPGFGDIKPELSAMVGHSRVRRQTCTVQRRNSAPANTFRPRTVNITVVREEAQMGKGILLWLLGIPLPIIIILLLIWH